MNKLFYLGAIGAMLYEAANVYFIMPLPGSQEMNSLGAAYLLYSWRWIFRVLFLLAIAVGGKAAFSARPLIAGLLAVAAAAVFYLTNFKMAADAMFLQPSSLTFAKGDDNRVGPERLVLGVEYKGEAKAYPIQYLGYHHQVVDQIGGKPIIVTYCTVCRTGRVFEPVVDGKIETFRLVGMDHFNAMFEDQSTKSWWRQATGEAVAGKRKGRILPEFPSTQTTLQKWSELFPQTLVMQPDEGFQEVYDSLSNYETGKRKGKLTRRDAGSWKDKSWVIGIQIGDEAKAYDWNRLQKERIVHDVIGKTPVLLALSSDKNSFVAFSRSNPDQLFSLVHDTLYINGHRFNFLGKSLQDSVPDLLKVPAYQEYWHSWKTFHPQTKKW
jgi:hypothetical protein